MEYAKFGNSGIQVSRLCLGFMALTVYRGSQLRQVEMKAGTIPEGYY